MPKQANKFLEATKMCFLLKYAKKIYESQNILFHLLTPLHKCFLDIRFPLIIYIYIHSFILYFLYMRFHLLGVWLLITPNIING